jgi:hypothetical protein
MFYQNIRKLSSASFHISSLPMKEEQEADRDITQTHSGLDPDIVQNSLLKPRNQEMSALSRGLLRLPNGTGEQQRKPGIRYRIKETIQVLLVIQQTALRGN